MRWDDGKSFFFYKQEYENLEAVLKRAANHYLHEVGQTPAVAVVDCVSFLQLAAGQDQDRRGWGDRIGVEIFLIDGVSPLYDKPLKWRGIQFYVDRTKKMNEKWVPTLVLGSGA